MVAQNARAAKARAMKAEKEAEEQREAFANLGKEHLPELAKALESSTRRFRQNAAKTMLRIAQEDPDALKPYLPQVVDALNRPEAQTRWECLDILTLLVPVDSRTCEKALDGAETALFDEENGALRLSAMRFLCKFGATTELRSKRVWPLIDEGVQCCHGDYEYPRMLQAIVDFSAGKLDAQVKEEAYRRFAFDAKSDRGMVGKRSSQILGNLS